MQNHIDLTGKRALIVGAEDGVGRAIAIRLAQEGMKLALAGLDAAALMRTAALTGRPLDMLVLPADITAPRGVGDIMHIMEGHFKGLDALVNSAGPDALALCRRTIPLLKTAERPVILDIAPGMGLSEGEADGIRVEALAHGGTDEAAEQAARIMRGEA